MTTTNPITWTNPESSTPEERELAQKLYDGGMSIAEVSDAIGRASSTIHRWVSENFTRKNYKIEEWKGKATPEEKQLAVETYLTYKSIPKVCEVMDRSYDTIYRWLKGAGIDTSVPKTKSKSKKVVRENLKLEKKIIKLESRLAVLEQQNEELRNVVATLATFNQL